VRTAPLTFLAASDGKTYTSDFTVLVRFLDQRNVVARKVSQHYEIKGPIAGLESAKNGEVIFYRQPELAAGVYTMESIVYDAPSGKSSVRFSTVEVTLVRPETLRMSSLVLVKGGEKVPDTDRRRDNPLLVNDVVLHPNLGEPVSKASKKVGFYFVAYPAAGKPAPDSILELFDSTGAAIGRLSLPLAAADSASRIQQVGRLRSGMTICSPGAVSCSLRTPRPHRAPPRRLAPIWRATARRLDGARASCS